MNPCDRWEGAVGRGEGPRHESLLGIRRPRFTSRCRVLALTGDGPVCRGKGQTDLGDLFGFVWGVGVAGTGLLGRSLCQWMWRWS